MDVSSINSPIDLKVKIKNKSNKNILNRKCALPKIISNSKQEENSDVYKRVLRQYCVSPNIEYANPTNDKSPNFKLSKARVKHSRNSITKSGCNISNTNQKDRRYFPIMINNYASQSDLIE